MRVLEPTMKDLKFTAAAVGLAVVISGCLSCSSAPPPPTGSKNVPAAAVGQQPRAPHVPNSVTSGRAPMEGACDLKQTLQLALHLQLRNQAELTQLLHDLYDPASPSFHKYLSVAAFSERFRVSIL